MERLSLSLSLLFTLLFAPVVVAQGQSDTCGMQAASPPQGAGNSSSQPIEAFKWMPASGHVRALVVFVQAEGDNTQLCIDTDNYRIHGRGHGGNLVDYNTYCNPEGSRYQSPSEDPATEWPAFDINGDRVMPQWAGSFIDPFGTSPAQYQQGSLSQFLWQMSRGTLRYEGEVYPDVVEVPQQTLNVGNQRAAAAFVIDHLNSNPMGINFDHYDRYINGTEQFVVGGDGIFDQLVLVSRSGQGIACFGAGGSECTTSNSIPTGLDGFLLNGGSMKFLGSKRVVSSVRDGSGYWVAPGRTLERAVSVAAHEIGHTMLHHHTCGRDHMSIMCGPMNVSMSASDRFLLGWINPVSIQASQLAQTSFTLSSDPMVGDALWIHGPAGSAGSPAVGDILIEARTFDGPWDRVPVLNDGDYADIANWTHEGLAVFQLRATSGDPTSAFNGIENTGRDNNGRVVAGDLEVAALRGEDPPHVAFAQGDVLSPLTVYRLLYVPSTLARRVAITDISVGLHYVSFKGWDNFLSSTASRSVTSNYTFGDLNLARIDDFVGTWAIGGALGLGGTHFQITSGTPTLNLLANAELKVLAGAEVTLQGPTGYTYPISSASGARITVNGSLDVFTALLNTSSSSGWRGIQFNAGASGTLNRTTISGVKNAPGGYAVRVYNAGLVVENLSDVNGSGGHGGIYASGSAADVLVSSGAVLRNHPSGYGLFVSNNASAFVTGATTTIQANSSGGIRADAFGDITVADGQILSNPGPGAYASSGGSIVVRRGYSVPGSPVASGTKIVMDGNIGGGFRAETDGEVITCETSNDFTDNGGTIPPFDVYAFEFSLVDAERSYWGHTVRSQIGTYAEDSFIDIDPILTAPAGSSFIDVCGVNWKGGDDTASVDGSDGLHARLAEAAQLRIAGQTADAAELLAGALADADSEAEFGPLAGAAARVIAQAEDVEATWALQAWAARAAVGSADSAPWAQRVLLSLAARRGESAAVQQVGQALLRARGQRAASHKLYAVRGLLEQAVRDRREETARQWLATAATLDAAASADLRRFVDVAFLREEGTEPPRVADAGVLKLDEADSFVPDPAAEALIELAPNPANTHVRVMVADAAFAAAEYAEVTVFDALGRVVLTPASVVQAQVTLFDVRSLPVGTYTVRVSYPAADERATTATARFTVSR